MEDVFERRFEEGGGVFFVCEKVKNGHRDPLFFIQGALTQHARHAKTQSADTFC